MLQHAAGDDERCGGYAGSRRGVAATPVSFDAMGSIAVSI